MGIRPLLDFKKNNQSTATSEDEVEDKPAEQEVIPSPDEAVDAFKKKFASDLGWTDKETWVKAGRAEDQWRDHNTFLDGSPTYFNSLRKKYKDQENRMKRRDAAAAAVMEEDRKKIREDAIKEAREAAAAGDADKAAQAVERAASTPPPEVSAWVSKNSWFNTDPAAAALAQAVCGQHASKSYNEQLQLAEEAVRKRFPEHFSDDDDLDDLPDFITRQPARRQEEENNQQREVRMSQAANVAAAANNPGNSARNRETITNKEKSFKDIPKSDQAAYEKYFAKKFQGRGLKPEDARETYAKRYWNSKV